MGLLYSKDYRLLDACFKGKKEAVVSLLAAGANIHSAWKVSGLQGGFRPLHMAVAGGHEEIIPILLDAGADLNEQSLKFEDWNTPELSLNTAAFYGHEKIFHMLIEEGLKRNKPSALHFVMEDHRTLLHSACQKACNLNIITFLLKNSFDPNAKNKNDITPFHLAASRTNNKAVIMEFFKAGGDDTIVWPALGRPVMFVKNECLMRPHIGTQEWDDIKAEGLANLYKKELKFT